SSAARRRAGRATTGSPLSGPSSPWRSATPSGCRRSARSLSSSARRGSSSCRTPARPTPTSRSPTRRPGTIAWPTSWLPRTAWAHHVLRTDPAIVLLGAEVAGGQRGVAKGEPAGVRLLGDLGGPVVADVGRQRGHEHQRVPHQLGDARSIRLDPHHAELAEAGAGV